MKRCRHVSCSITESQHKFMKEMGLSPSELLQGAIKHLQDRERWMRGTDYNANG